MQVSEAEEANAPPRELGDLGLTNAFHDHITLSYLWVLGTYELIRTLDQRAREREIFSQGSRQRISEAKTRFARIRVPLAKLEAARAHADTDRSFPWPAYSPDLGVGWRVAESTVIGRLELSNLLLELFESLPAT